jgi:hypothetical protein
MNSFSICINAYWYSVIQNAIGCAIGSIVAIVFSFYIYWRSNWNNNRLAKNEKLADELNRLRSFKLMLQRAIKNSDELIKHIGEFIPKLKAHPNEFPLLIITPLGNFKRITETITVEKTGAAYTKHFPGVDSIKEFTSILESIDFLYDAFLECRDVVQRASLNHFDRVMKVSDKFDIADKLLIDVTSDPRNHNVILKDLLEAKANFIKERGELSNIDSVYNLYLLPMRIIMAALIKGGIMNDFIREYTHNITKCIEYYLYIGSGYDKFVLEMEGIEKSLKENLANLEGKAKKILERDLD